MFRLAISAFLVLLAGMPATATAQRRVPRAASAPAETMSITIAAKIGSKTYRANSAGECRYAPEASIRGAPASLWMVQYGGPHDAAIKQLNLTLWRLKDGGPDQLSLALETSAGSHRIQTGGEGENAGEGSVTILPSGPGGRLEITGKEAGGKPVQITIDCPAFAGVEAEGG